MKAWAGHPGRSTPRAVLTPLLPCVPQVRFQTVHAFPTLHETKFRHALTYKPQTNLFEFVLSADQVSKLMVAFIEEQKRNQRR